MSYAPKYLVKFDCIVDGRRTHWQVHAVKGYNVT